MTITTQPTESVISTHGHLIGGSWITSDSVGESINPSTGEVVGRFYAGGRAEAIAGIRAAREAMYPWSRDVHLRAAALHELAAALERRTGEIALMVTREGGRLLEQTLWETTTAAQWLRYSAALCLTANTGRSGVMAPGAYVHSEPEPSGVAGIITPWNAPILLTVRALGPALAAGCTTVIKMPAQTALAAGLFAEVVAGCTMLPPGVVNIFVEEGNEGAPMLVESPDVDVLSYTGSTAVGQRIAAAASGTHKRLNLELGGKTPLIIFDDADVDNAVETAVRAVTTMNGQFCVAGSRVLVQRSIANRVRSSLGDALAHVTVGPPEDPASQVGPLIDRAAAERVDRFVEDALRYSSPVVRGGLVADGPLSRGAFYRPTMLEVADAGVPLVQEEIFGPVQTFEVFDDDEEAISRANATRFGLGAAVFTAHSGRARAVGREVRSGVVWINTWGLLPENFEQGGSKQSSNGGYLCGPRSIDEFQELKVYVELAPPPAPAKESGQA